MRVGMHRVGRCASIAAFVVAGVVVAAVPSAASGSPKAGVSMMAAGNGLTVTFVARSSGFSSPVESYAWTFGDGESTTTSTPTVTHTYASASTFSPAVVETAGGSAMATATGTLRLSDCPVGQSQCTEALHNAGTVQLLQANGPVSQSSPAHVEMFVGPFRIPSCEAAIRPAVALSDSGFTGELTVTITYTTSQPQNVATTCFSSPVAFVDADGQSVHRGALPMCQTASGPPCVESIETSGSTVTKVLLIPPGDPKVGAP
jgi:PKD repeat protein